MQWEKTVSNLRNNGEALPPLLVITITIITIPVSVCLCMYAYVPRCAVVTGRLHGASLYLVMEPELRSLHLHNKRLHLLVFCQLGTH